MLPNRSKQLFFSGFLAVILLMMAVVYVGFKQMSAINNNIEIIVNQYNAKTSYITTMYTAARERAIVLLRMLDMDDPFERDEANLYFNVLATRYAVARIELSKLEFDEQEKIYANEQLQFVQHAMPQLESAISLLMEDRTEEARRLLLDSAIPAQDEVLKQLSRMMAYQEKAAKRSLADTRRTHERAVEQISLLALGALLLSIAIAWFVISYATRTKEAIFAQVALESIGDAVITTDASGKINYLNSVAEEMTGWRFSEAEGMAIIDVFNISQEDDLNSYNKYIQSSIESSEQLNISENVQLKSHNSEVIDIEFSITPIYNKYNRNIGTAVAFRKMSQEHKLRQQLSFQACHDALTGLINRYEFEKRLKQLIKTSLEKSETHIFLFLDLDKFKIVNDTCGHVAGDELLRQLPTLLHKHIRSNDTLARLGGDEFGILLEDCELHQASIISEKILNEVENFQFVWQDKTFRIGVSIGVVEVNKQSNDINNLMHLADAACYTAKDRGRNRFHVAKEDDSGIADRRVEMQWVARINDALDNDNFVLHYQSIVATDSRHNKGAYLEILLRMIDKDGGLYPPGAFIPAAERYNLMMKIDSWVLTNTLKFLSENKGSTKNISKCSINLSGQSIGDESFLLFIKNSIKYFDIKPDIICFEITETAAITNVISATNFINELKKLGCFFSLDDFGSGFSSFAYLKNLPVDFIKIDGMFVRDIADDPLDQEMVRSITGIAKAMGKLTIAEFVENDSIKEILLDIGVDYIQGYGVSKPEPLETLFLNIVTTKKAQAL